ncbi:hypothetical protein [Desulfocapsa sulfexigens]|uniref:hypothetical protein n=1 Tax=Desulfocapsa sulfexigens TaxID=65555 RepID=UPI0005A55777|nr:hypothetical protein [Desulfocapsa sulfexigens]
MSQRNDRKLTRELLIYDWLRCGQRKLPVCLEKDAGAERLLKDHLYQQLPMEVPGLYFPKERNRFFKQTVFYRFSAEFFSELGVATTGPSCFAFLAEREESLFRLQKVVPFAY